MAFTRQDWARGFLTALGNPNPSQATVNWVVGWTTLETSTGGGALYNLLNTTQQASDSTFFNYLNPPQDTFGVQDYTSFVEGVQENAAVLQQNHPGYATLLQALQSNDISTLQSSAVSQGLNTWGTHSAAANPAGLTAQGAAHLGDSFTYGSATGVSPLITTSPTSPTSGICNSALGQNPLTLIPIFCSVSGALGSIIDGLSPNWQAVIFLALSIFKSFLIFATGAILIVIGIYLIVQPDVSSLAGQAMNMAASAASENEGEGEAAGEDEGESPPPSPATPASSTSTRSSQQHVSVSGAKHSKIEKAEEVAKVAAIA